MDTIIAIAGIALGVALVVAGADAFVDGLLGVGERLRVSPFVLVVLLSGFELENLAAGIAANAKDLPGAAAGTVFGGVTFLALGVAGIGALIAPIRATLPRGFLLWTVAAPLPTLLLSLDGELSRLDGAVLLVWFAIALVGVARAGREVLYADAPEKQRFSVLRLLGGLAVLTVGGTLMGGSLRSTVDRLGVSDTLLGNTAIAASVEAEEVGRVAVPTKRGKPELALGNIAGTIVHFIAFNAGVIALVKPLSLDSATLDLHLPVAVGSTALLCGLIGLRGRIGRLDGAILVVLYAAYVTAAVLVAL
jgi:cation:H+ antiporter